MFFNPLGSRILGTGEFTGAGIIAYMISTATKMCNGLQKCITEALKTQPSIWTSLPSLRENWYYELT